MAEEKCGVYKWLGRQLRVHLTDGRIIEGKFVCTDNVPNIILSKCKVLSLKMLIFCTPSIFVALVIVDYLVAICIELKFAGKERRDCFALLHLFSSLS